MTNATAARMFFSRFAAGHEPNGVRPDDCGPFAAQARELWTTYEQDGIDAAQAQARTWLNDPKQVRGLAALIASEPPDITTIQPVSARELAQKTFAPIRWAVPGLIPEGVTLLVGRPKMGKSWICLDLAIAIASGGCALGKTRVECGDVLYLALEDSQRRLQSRLDKLLRGEAPPRAIDFIAIDHRLPRLNEGGLTWIEAWVVAHPHARLIIIDTFVKFRPRPDGNKDIYNQDYESVQELVHLASTRNIAILVVHHSRKGKAEDALEEISGSFGLSGGVDGALVLRRDRGQAAAVLTVTGRDVDEQELALMWDATLTQWTIAGSAEDFRQTQIRDSILKIFRAERRRLTPKEVYDILSSDTDVTYNTVKQRLYQMSKDGALLTNSGAYWLPLTK